MNCCRERFVRAPHAWRRLTLATRSAGHGIRPDAPPVRLKFAGASSTMGQMPGRNGVRRTEPGRGRGAVASRGRTPPPRPAAPVSRCRRLPPPLRIGAPRPSPLPTAGGFPAQAARCPTGAPEAIPPGPLRQRAILETGPRTALSESAGRTLLAWYSSAGAATTAAKSGSASGANAGYSGALRGKGGAVAAGSWRAGRRPKIRGRCCKSQSAAAPPVDDTFRLTVHGCPQGPSMFKTLAELLMVLPRDAKRSQFFDGHR